MFCLQICHHRGICTSDAFTKVGIDAGQKSLKITLQVCDPSIADDDLNGVNRLHIIVIAMDVPEADEVLREMWRCLDVDNSLPESCLIVCDYKAINLMLGQSGHTSAFPCPFCYSFKYSTRKGGNSNCHTLFLVLNNNIFIHTFR